MIECNSCEFEHPEDPKELLDWVVEQKQDRVYDEMVHGTSYHCSECTRRFPPKDMIVNIENSEENFGQSIVDQE